MTTRFWVKAYDVYNRPSNKSYDDKDRARWDFKAKMLSEQYYFIQMGAWTQEGPIVLDEWRPQSNSYSAPDEKLKQEMLAEYGLMYVAPERDWDFPA